MTQYKGIELSIDSCGESTIKIFIDEYRLYVENQGFCITKGENSYYLDWYEIFDLLKEKYPSIKGE